MKFNKQSFPNIAFCNDFECLNDFEYVQYVDKILKKSSELNNIHDYIHVGDGCCRRDVLMTTIRCWRRIWPKFLVINIHYHSTLRCPTSRYHQHLYNQHLYHQHHYRQHHCHHIRSVFYELIHQLLKLNAKNRLIRSKSVQTFLFSCFFDQTFSSFFSQMIVEFIVDFVQPSLKLVLTHFRIQILIFEYVICQDHINSISSNQFQISWI